MPQLGDDINREAAANHQRHRPVLYLDEWLAWQNRLQEVHVVDHSMETCHLIELVQFIDLQSKYV